MTTIITALLYRSFAVAPESLLGFYWQGTVVLLIIFSVILTVWSGIEYFQNLPKEGDA